MLMPALVLAMTATATTRVQDDICEQLGIPQAVRFINGRALVEASGNVTVDRVKEIAGTGVDFISTGAITHSAAAADISLKVRT